MEEIACGKYMLIMCNKMHTPVAEMSLPPNSNWYDASVCLGKTERESSAGAHYHNHNLRGREHMPIYSDPSSKELG